jgi:flagellar biosynthesis protein FlhB
MTIEHYTWLLLVVVLLSLVINVVLLIRLDMMYYFIRYTKYTIAILHMELEKIKNEHKSTKGSERA